MINKQEFVWLTKQIELLKACKEAGISDEFRELSTRLYWKLRKKRDRLVFNDKDGVVA